MKLTDELRRRLAARDAGNQSMRQGGRNQWSLEDYSAACAEFSRLEPKPIGRYASGVQACHELLES